MQELLVRPLGFFHNLRAYDPDWRKGLGWCMALGILVFAGSILMARQFDNQFSLGVQLFIGTLLGMGLGFAVWLGLGTVILLLAGWEAKGWELVGWVCAPAVAVMAVWVVLTLLMPIANTLPPRPVATDVSGLAAWLVQYQAAVQGTPIYRIMQICVALCLPPMLWVLYSGLKALTPNRAVLSTALIGGIALVILVGWLN